MEILQNDEKLREEIINDAKTKAERIISKADRECEDIKKSAEKETEVLKKEYESNIRNIIDDKVNLLYASVDIEVKKHISSFSGDLIDNIFEDIKSFILDNKELKYKDVMLSIIKISASKINDTSFFIETNEDELKKIPKSDILDLKLKKGKIEEVIISEKKLKSFILFSSDKKSAAYISIDNFINYLKIETRTSVYNMITKGK